MANLILWHKIQPSKSVTSNAVQGRQKWGGPGHTTSCANLAIEICILSKLVMFLSGSG